jgi:hypothetical protein
VALVVVSDKRYVNRGRPTISINPKLRRIIINATARELMIEHYKSEFEHVLLLMDPEVPNCFWMRPISADTEGARQLNATSGSTRTVSCSLLLNELKWKSTKTESYAVIWDSENNAAKVDLAQGQQGGKKK